MIWKYLFKYFYPDIKDEDWPYSGTYEWEDLHKTSTKDLIDMLKKDNLQHNAARIIIVLFERLHEKEKQK